MAHHSRSFSIISAHTDFEICAVADLLSPSVTHTRSYAEEQERIGIPVDDLDDSLDPSNILHASGQALSTRYLLLEHEEPLSPSFGSHFPTNSSANSESEFDTSSDDHYSPSSPSTYAYHLPRRTRTRSRASNGHISASDSDTPSLTSSTTSFSSRSYSTSPPISPDTLQTPIDPIANQYLTIIEERAAEDQGMGGRRHTRGSGSGSFATVGYGAQVLRKPFVARTPELRPKGRVFNVDHLRLNVPPPNAHHFPSLSPSSTFDITPPMTNSPYSPSSPYARTPKSSLNRFIPGGLKGNKTTTSLESGWSTSPSASTVTSRTVRKEESKEDKARKAEEKKRKKEEAKAEAKAKVERLAEELKERQRRKAATFDRQSVHSRRSFGRPNRRYWDEDIGMYNGLGAL